MEDLQAILAENHFDEAEILRSPAGHDLPEAWQAVIRAENADQKRAVLSTLWAPFADHLPLTTVLIKKMVDAVVVLEQGTYQMVYIFEVAGVLSAHAGGLPVTKGPFLDELPADLAAFYRTVHNGWVEKLSGGLGFLALTDMERLSEEEWGILEELPQPDLDLQQTFYVFHNAGGGYLCFHRDECLIFWTSKAPKRKVNFWPLIDAWIEIGLTN